MRSCVCDAGNINVKGSEGEIGIAGLSWDESLENEGGRVVLPFSALVVIQEVVFRYLYFKRFEQYTLAALTSSLATEV